jgi:hypothetical protein
MLNTITLAWGILSIFGMFIGFIPCLGSLNWLNIPFAVIGTVVGIVAVVSQKNGASRAGVTGLVLCVIASLFGMIRLTLGGGFL